MAYMYYSSPSHHQISPLSRSTSRISSVRRSASFTYGSGYGYFSSRPRRNSLSRSSSSSYGLVGQQQQSLFGRALADSSLYYTPPLQSVALQRSTPHYSDKYPHVRYSYGNLDTGLALISQQRSLWSDRLDQQKGRVSQTLSHYTNRLYTEPRWPLGHPRSGLGREWESRAKYQPVRSLHQTPPTTTSHSRHMDVDQAVGLYKNRYMTVGALSKYWLSSNTWTSRREKEWNLSRHLGQRDYQYTGRYSSLSKF